MNDCKVSHHCGQHEKRLRQRVAGVGRHLLIGQRLRKVHLSKSKYSGEGCKRSPSHEMSKTLGCRAFGRVAAAAHMMHAQTSRTSPEQTSSPPVPSPVTLSFNIEASTIRVGFWGP